jgi:hypothetical protein
MNFQIGAQGGISIASSTGRITVYSNGWSELTDSWTPPRNQWGRVVPQAAPPPQAPAPQGNAPAPPGALQRQPRIAETEASQRTRTRRGGDDLRMLGAGYIRSLASPNQPVFT